MQLRYNSIQDDADNVVKFFLDNLSSFYNKINTWATVITVIILITKTRLKIGKQHDIV